MIERLSFLPNNVFWVEAAQYNLAMLFWRVTEYRESENPDFKGKSFTLVDYMEWYAAQHGEGKFTYADDWHGFNVPGESINAALCKMLDDNSCQDRNKYDVLMSKIWVFCNSVVQDKTFYLIGTAPGDTETLQHEYAHALWGQVDQYQYEQGQNIEQLGIVAQTIGGNLKEMGYGEDVHDDEIQAYLATGVRDKVTKGIAPRTVKRIVKPFQQTFRDFSQEVAHFWEKK
jgi:hypothetical protein